MNWFIYTYFASGSATAILTPYAQGEIRAYALYSEGSSGAFKQKNNSSTCSYKKYRRRYREICGCI